MVFRCLSWGRVTKKTGSILVNVDAASNKSGKVKGFYLMTLVVTLEPSFISLTTIFTLGNGTLLSTPAAL